MKIINRVFTAADGYMFCYYYSQQSGFPYIDVRDAAGLLKARVTGALNYVKAQRQLRVFFEKHGRANHGLHLTGLQRAQNASGSQDPPGR